MRWLRAHHKFEEDWEGGQCHRNNGNYQIDCVLWEEQTPTMYIGKKSRNINTREGEHLQRNGMGEDYFMREHMEEKHPGLEERVRATVTNTNQDCLTRQVLLIKRTNKALLNTKSEWFHPPLYRIRSEVENMWRIVVNRVGGTREERVGGENLCLYTGAPSAKYFQQYLYRYIFTLGC